MIIFRAVFLRTSGDAHNEDGGFGRTSWKPFRIYVQIGQRSQYALPVVEIIGFEIPLRVSVFFCHPCDTVYLPVCRMEEGLEAPLLRCARQDAGCLRFAIFSFGKDLL